jgi:hypothetical protein
MGRFDVGGGSDARCQENESEKDGERAISEEEEEAVVGNNVS